MSVFLIAGKEIELLIRGLNGRVHLRPTHWASQSDPVGLDPKRVPLGPTHLHDRFFYSFPVNYFIE
jgi:hypothetical protein